MEIFKKDIEILNLIVNESLTEEFVIIDFFNKINKKDFEIENIKIGYNDEDEFKRLIKIIDYYEAGDLINLQFGICLRKNSNTFYFIKEGGFNKIYEQQLKLIEKENIEFEKSKIDLDLAKRMIKDYRITKN